MEANTHRDDVQAIKTIIARQFASLSWTPRTSADWDRFAADFFPEAALYPAARPAKRQTVEAFVERMKSLEGTKLRSFEEAVLGTEISVFGTVAVALAVCEMTENDAEVSRCCFSSRMRGHGRLYRRLGIRRARHSLFPSGFSARRLGSDRDPLRSILRSSKAFSA
jgi:hypothetical protein